VRFGSSGSSKVDDFGTNRKRVCDFLFVSHCDYGPAPFLRYTSAYWLKIAYFSYTPLLFGAPAGPAAYVTLEFRGEVNR